MARPNDFAGVAGLVIFGVIFAVLGLVTVLVGVLALKSLGVSIIGGALIGAALVCGFRVWQESRSGVTD